MGDEQQPEQSTALEVRKPKPPKLDVAMYDRLAKRAGSAIKDEYKEAYVEAIRDVRSKALATLSAKMDDVSPNALATVIGILQDKEALLTGENKGHASNAVQVNIQLNGLPSGKDGLIRTLTKGVEASVSPLGGNPAEFAYPIPTVAEDQGAYGQSDKESDGPPSIKANASSPVPSRKMRKSLKAQGSKGGGGGQQIPPA